MHNTIVIIIYYKIGKCIEKKIHLRIIMQYKRVRVGQ